MCKKHDEPQLGIAPIKKAGGTSLNTIIQTIKNFFVRPRTPQRRPDDQQHVMTEDEKLDQSLMDSFPASDPPGHFSKSSEDQKMNSTG
jgi:hypothetical protein